MACAAAGIALDSAAPGSPSADGVTLLQDAGHSGTVHRHRHHNRIGTATSSAAAPSTAAGDAVASAPTADSVPTTPEQTDTDVTSDSTAVAPAATGAATGDAQLVKLSSLSWRSGAYIPGSNPADYDAFAAWRGQPLDVAVDWPARSSWDDIVNPDWLYSAWADTPYTKAFGVAPIPEDDSSATMAGCASGAYDDKWRQFGTNIQSAGLADSTIIRLGWEFNGDWYKWSAKDPAEYVSCWHHIVTAARTTAPGLRWDWTVNRGTSQSLSDPRAAYPGDDYVDIVGVDSYDMWPGARTQQAWNEQYGGDYGLKFWSDFAQQHGKLLSIPEWGVIPGTSQQGGNGGDNAFYVQKMVEFFRSMGPNLAYESYFNEPDPATSSSIFSPNKNPDAASEYRALYSGS